MRKEVEVEVEEDEMTGSWAFCREQTYNVLIEYQQEKRLVKNIGVSNFALKHLLEFDSLY